MCQIFAIDNRTELGYRGVGAGVGVVSAGVVGVFTHMGVGVGVVEYWV